MNYSERLYRQAWIAAGLATLLLGGCAQHPQLVPAPDSHVSAGNSSIATNTVAAVTITAKASSWPGAVDIENLVTPMKITVKNNSNRSLRVNYSEFALVDEDGVRYAALPPYGVEGSVEEPVLSRRYAAIRRPGFSHRGFRVAPHYGTLYPSISPYLSHRLYADPSYYSHYHGYWRQLDVALPTPEMLRRVLPEGVLEPQGDIDGYLYFEKVPEDQNSLQLEFDADLVDAESGQMFATVSIPFIANPVTRDGSAR